MGRRVICVLLLLFGARAGEAGPAASGPFHKIAIILLRENPDEMIDTSVKTSILRRLRDVREWGADCVVFDIESYGGEVSSSIETGDEIFALGREVHTIAYVHRKTVSGAAMLAVSCNEIVMNEVAIIGDSQAIFMTPEGVQVAPEKFQTPVAAKFRSYAKGNGYPVEVAEAMVRAEMEVVRYRTRPDPATGSPWVYVRVDEDQPELTPEQLAERGWSDPQLVVRKGEIAMFTAEQAVDFGVCSRIVPTLNALLDTLSGPETQVRRFDWTWAERVSRWLLGMRWLLFLVGAGALYFALKIPGTGVPEALALICFGLFFGASAIAGFAGSIELVLFFIGIVLLAVEIFVIPGFGIPGVVGIVCLIASLALAAIPENMGDLPGPGPYLHFLLPMARDFVIGSLGAALVVFFLARFLPDIPLFNALRLAPPGLRGTPPIRTMDAPEGSFPMLDTVGVADTDLRPSGRAVFGGKVRDVVAEGAWVAKGARVRVVQLRGSVIVVRPVSEGAEA